MDKQQNQETTLSTNIEEQKTFQISSCSPATSPFHEDEPMDLSAEDNKIFELFL
jgi:hypothetical protein